MADVRSFHRGVEQLLAERLLSMVLLGLPRRDTHLTETVILLVDLPMLISQEGLLILHQEEPTQMVAIRQGLRGRHQVTARVALVNMILFLGQSVHMLHWLVSLFCVYSQYHLIHLHFFFCIMVALLIDIFTNL